MIGLFFGVVGLLLFGYSLVRGDATAVSINRWCGALFFLFGMFMIYLQHATDKRTANVIKKEKERYDI